MLSTGCILLQPCYCYEGDNRVPLVSFKQFGRTKQSVSLRTLPSKQLRSSTLVRADAIPADAPPLVDVQRRQGHCYGCGTELQITDHDALGFVDPAKFAKKAVHKQLSTMMCLRCQQLSNGLMIPAVEDFSQVAQELMLNGKRLISPDDLRLQLRQVSAKPALVVLLVDLLDASGSFMGRVRDLVGKNPIILIGTKADLLPVGTKPAAVVEWLLGTAGHKRLNAVSAHLVSSRTGVGMGHAASAIRLARKGRDVVVLGAANVGKSAFVRALIKQMTSFSSAHYDAAASAAARYLPVESAMPGTTLSFIPLRTFSAGGTLYDTPGIHLHHRLPHLLTPDELKAIHPRRRLRPFVAPTPLQVQEQYGEEADETDGGDDAGEGEDEWMSGLLLGGRGSGSLREARRGTGVGGRSGRRGVEMARDVDEGGADREDDGNVRVGDEEDEEGGVAVGGRGRKRRRAVLLQKGGPGGRIAEGGNMSAAREGSGGGFMEGMDVCTDVGSMLGDVVAAGGGMDAWMGGGVATGETGRAAAEGGVDAGLSEPGLERGASEQIRGRAGGDWAAEGPLDIPDDVKLVPFGAPDPQELADAEDAEEAEVAAFVKQRLRDVYRNFGLGRHDGSYSATYLWGGLARIDVVECPANTQLVFFAPPVVTVTPVGLLGEDEEVEAAAGHEELFGQTSVALRGGLKVAKEVTLEAVKTSRALADVAVSGLPGWVSVFAPKEAGVIKLRVWAPKGVEVFVRPPMPVASPLTL